MTLFSEELIRTLGLTILDSLWQGAIVLLLCTLILWLMRKEPARWRYRVVLLGIFLLPLASIITFSGYYQTATVIEGEMPAMAQSGWSDPLPEQSINQTADSGMLDQWNFWARANASWVALVWVVGLGLFALRLMGGFYMVRTLKTYAVAPQDPIWAEKLKSLCQTLQIRFYVRLKESVKVNSPVVLGYLKPMIIFPIGLLQGLPTDQVEAILLHELAHIKRHDYLLNMIVSLLQVLFFYHPAYWWLQRQLDNEREYSCDDMVLGQKEGMSLVRALTAVKEFQLNSYTPSLGFASEKNQLLKRVERIMKKKTRTNWLGGLISTSALLLSFFLMSYQSHVEPEGIESKSPDLEEITALPDVSSSSLQADSVTVKQAVLQLLEKEENNLELELDGEGSLIGLKKNGAAISGAELKVYQAAHARLREYTSQEAKLEQKAELLEEELRQVKRKLEASQLNEEIKQYKYRLVEELKQQEKEEEITRYRLVQDLKSNEESMMEIYERLLDELKSMEPEARQKLQEVEANRQKYLEQARLYEEVARKLNETIAPGTYTFLANEAGQMEAISYLARQSRTSNKALLVVNDELKQDWTIDDIDQMDKNLVITSVRVSRAGDARTDRYEEQMKGRDRLVEVNTTRGSAGFQRPTIPKISEWRQMSNEQEMKERFSKIMIETMGEDELLPDGLKDIELSTDSFLIDGKKQSRKVLKKYLKLYEEVTGKALPKGETIEFRE